MPGFPPLHLFFFFFPSFLIRARIYDASGDGAWLARDTAQFLEEPSLVTLFPLDGELYALKSPSAGDGLLRYLEGQTPMWEDLGTNTMVTQAYGRNFIYQIDYHELLL